LLRFEFRTGIVRQVCQRGMLVLNGLPRLHHPVFAAPRFHLASRNRFFLCVLATDAKFDADGTAKFLKKLRPHAVEAVPS
jgi:hypothetical protein